MAKKQTQNKYYNVGDYFKVDRFDIVQTFKDQEPLYVAVVGDQKLPIAHVFSCLVPMAKGVELRKEPMPGLFSNDEQHPYLWVPVYYDRSVRA